MVGRPGGRAVPDNNNTTLWPNLQVDLQAGTQPKLSSKLGRVWQYLFSSTFKVMSFAMRVSTNALATPDSWAKISRGTVPSNIMVTHQRPDMVIIINTTTPPTVYLVGLSCPLTRNIKAATNRKRASDIKDAVKKFAVWNWVSLWRDQTEQKPQYVIQGLILFTRLMTGRSQPQPNYFEVVLLLLPSSAKPQFSWAE